MKTSNRSGWKLAFLPVLAAMVVLAGGCTTPEHRSFNDDYKENLLTKPTYYIQDQEATSFTITVQEGTPSNGPERATDVKEAATAVARAECQKLGWEKSILNYTDDRYLGWMHVVVAKVTRK